MGVIDQFIYVGWGLIHKAHGFSLKVITCHARGKQYMNSPHSTRLRQRRHLVQRPGPSLARTDHPQQIPSLSPPHHHPRIRSHHRDPQTPLRALQARGAWGNAMALGGRQRPAASTGPHKSGGKPSVPEEEGHVTYMRPWMSSKRDKIEIRQEIKTAKSQ